MTAIYNDIGKGYDATRRADPEILNILMSLMSLHEDGLYLDVGCGTGNYTHSLAQVSGKWKAFDQSEIMIERAKEKSSNIDWGVFDVIKTPYESGSFNAIVCTLAIHHFQDLDAAFKEVSRILAPQGKFVIFTSTPEQMETYWLNHYFPTMLECSIRQMPSINKIEAALGNADLELIENKPFFVTDKLDDLFLYSGKQRPEMYLSEPVRAGISSFRKFCSDVELESGLSLLVADIKSGNIHNIIKQFDKNKGDYCFLVAQK